jgi:hypothetical protein
METSMSECASESVAKLNEEELDIVVGGQGAWEAAKEKAFEAELKRLDAIAEKIMRQNDLR